ncbi:MAG: hypothetical protein KGH64_06200 [Candidatus Micrarchaeota archaeon]|nr:hypothetical protein [Candidatus Micrarchaeota archaeon]MDE1834899.1 hypothetical protein [Candidatus Micrarchaeota archaeon]MDE1860029.1 hypothetical protein [Candidatus Micrarchaeota archaeon]
MAMLSTNTRRINATEQRHHILRDASTAGAGNTFFTDRFKTLKNSLRKTGLAIALSVTTSSAVVGLFPTPATASDSCSPASAAAYTQYLHGPLTGTNTILTSNIDSNVMQSSAQGSPNINMSLYQTKGNQSILLQSVATIDFPSLNMEIPSSTYLLQFSPEGSNKVSYQTTINDPPPVNGISATFTYAQLGMTSGQTETLTITASNLLVQACTIGPISSSSGQLVTYTLANPPTSISSSITFQYLGPPTSTSANANSGNIKANNNNPSESSAPGHMHNRKVNYSPKITLSKKHPRLRRKDRIRVTVPGVKGAKEHLELFINGKVVAKGINHINYAWKPMKLGRYKIKAINDTPGIKFASSIARVSDLHRRHN